MLNLFFYQSVDSYASVRAYGGASGTSDAFFRIVVRDEMIATVIYFFRL